MLPLVVTGVPLEELPFPEGSAVALIIRGDGAGAAGAGHHCSRPATTCT